MHAVSDADLASMRDVIRHMDVPTDPLPDNPDELKRLVSSLRKELSVSKKEIARKAQ